MHGKDLVHRGHLKENETTSVWYRYYKGNIWCTQDRRIKKDLVQNLYQKTWHTNCVSFVHKSGHS